MTRAFWTRAIFWFYVGMGALWIKEGVTAYIAGDENCALACVGATLGWVSAAVLLSPIAR